MKLYAPIAKIDREQRLVFGYAATETTDAQGEIVRKTAIEAALPDYLRFGNIREMHQPSAVGVTTEADMDDKGLRIAARVVDDNAWKKVMAGVYKGFSIGGQVTERDRLDRHVITGCRITEISLVDRPANPEAVFEMWKLDSADDTPYADPAARKFPLDTVAHIRAAWAFINRPDIAAHYSPNETAAIRARIVAAWRRAIDPAGPPALRREQQAKFLRDDGDDRLRKAAARRRRWQAIHDHAAALGAHGDAAATAKASDIADAGDDDLARDFSADIAKGRRARAQAVHDHAVAAGADCDLAKGGAPAAVDDLLADEVLAEDILADEALAKAMADNRGLAKSLRQIAAELATVSDELAAAEARIARLEALPQAPKGALRAIAKGEDVTAIPDAAADTGVGSGVAQSALALIKAAHGNPRLLGRG